MMKSCTCNREWLGYARVINGLASEEDLTQEHFRLTTVWLTSAASVLRKTGHHILANKLDSLASALPLCPLHLSAQGTACGRRLIERLDPANPGSAYTSIVNVKRAVRASTLILHPMT